MHEGEREGERLTRRDQQHAPEGHLVRCISAKSCHRLADLPVVVPVV